MNDWQHKLEVEFWYLGYRDLKDLKEFFEGVILAQKDTYKPYYPPHIKEEYFVPERYASMDLYNKKVLNKIALGTYWTRNKNHQLVVKH